MSALAGYEVLRRRLEVLQRGCSTPLVRVVDSNKTTVKISQPANTDSTVLIVKIDLYGGNIHRSH